MRKKKTTNDFINEANIIHNGKYDYSKSIYDGYHTKLCIVCPIHGEFWQRPSDHLSGKGCPKCNGGTKDTTEDFINKSVAIHGHKYIYNNVRYINSHTDVSITCPIHGEFLQKPNNHVNGNGCPKCRTVQMKSLLSGSNNEFVEKASRIHNNKYNYSRFNYINARTESCIICPKHAEFYQTPDSHLHGHGCPKCANLISACETEIANIFKDFEIELGNRKILNGKEIDLYIPSLRIGIEYNGLLWHSEEYGRDMNYHLSKLIECNKQGIGLIQIFEDEWINHRDICEYRIKEICGINDSLPISANNCEIKEIKDKRIICDFLNRNHLNGLSEYSIPIGAYYKDELVSVMTFIDNKNGLWQINRFAIDLAYRSDDLFSAMFNYFVNIYNDFKEILLEADRRWLCNEEKNIYTNAGFEFNSYAEPYCWKYNQSTNHYKRFREEDFDESKNRKYNTNIWDCGMIKYIFVGNSDKK